jgi:hypothetical protein
VLVWPDPPGKFVNIDRAPDRHAQTEAFAVFQEFVQLFAGTVGAMKDEASSIPFLRYTDEAQKAFDEWRENLECRLRSGAETEAFESMLAKHRKLVPALSLIYHLADGHVGPVDLESFERAVATSRYLESHARRVYAVAINPEMAAARTLAKHLQENKIKTEDFTAGDVLRKGWSGLGTLDQVERALKVLIDLDWVAAVPPTNTAGRPRVRYQINPKIHDLAPETADENDDSPAGGAESGDNTPPPADRTDETASAKDRGEAANETDGSRRDPQDTFGFDGVEEVPYD